MEGNGAKMSRKCHYEASIFIHLLIHSFNTCILRIYYMPGQWMQLIKTPALMVLSFQWGGQNTRNEEKKMEKQLK